MNTGNSVDQGSIPSTWILPAERQSIEDDELGLFTDEDREELDVRFAAALAFVNSKTNDEEVTAALSGAPARLLQVCFPWILRLGALDVDERRGGERKRHDLAKSNLTLSSNTKAIKQQAEVGPCKGKRPQKDLVKAALHDAWKDLGQMSQNAAKQKYIEVLTKIVPTWAALEQKYATSLLEMLSNKTGSGHQRVEYIPNRNPANHYKPLIQFVDANTADEKEDAHEYGEAAFESAYKVQCAIDAYEATKQKDSKLRKYYLGALEKVFRSP